MLSNNNSVATRSSNPCGQIPIGSVKDMHQLGPFIRKIICCLHKSGASAAWSAYRALGIRPQRRRCRESRAVSTVLTCVAVEVAQKAIKGTADTVYERYFPEDCPDQSFAPTTLGESLVQALNQGEESLVQFVAQEAASVQGLTKPSRRLVREVIGRIELCELVAYEASRVQRC